MEEAFPSSGTNETVADGDVQVTVADGRAWVRFLFVSIYHYGFHGSEVHCETVGQQTLPCQMQTFR